MLTEVSNNGLKLSQIVAGVMHWGSWGADLNSGQVLELVEHCLEHGVTSFDHADIYGDYSTESLFGKALKDKSSLRSSMQLISKCGIKLVSKNRPAHKIKSYDTSREHIIASAERSLKNLSTDYLDLFLIHRPSPLMEMEEIASAFSELKNAGKVLHFGVSNFTAVQFDGLRKYFPISTNQVEFSLMALDSMQNGLFDHAMSQGYRPMAWSPLSGGTVFSNITSERVSRIKKIAHEFQIQYNASLDQILLAWILQHPARIIPVLGTSKKDRISRAVRSLEFKLSQEEWFQLLQASTGVEVP